MPDYREEIETIRRHRKRLQEIGQRELKPVKHLKTARETSSDLAAYQPDAKAWVYVFVHPEHKPRYGVRFTIAPETTIKGEPGLRLIALAGFKGGVCVFSKVGQLQPVEESIGF
jgi:hypothetical protein